MSSDDFSLDTAGVWLDEPEPVTTALPVEQPAIATQGQDVVPLPLSQIANEKLPAGELLFFDLETIPDYSRLHTFGLPEVPPVPDEAAASTLPDIAKVVAGTAAEITKVLRNLPAPGEWLDKLAAAETAGKNRSGVHKDIESARGLRDDVIKLHEDRRKLLSTTPEYCSICALGIAVGGGPVLSYVVRPDMEGVEWGNPISYCSERTLLELFWGLVGKAERLVAFNGLYFDIPVLMVRSALLGVPVPRVLNTSPYNNKDVIDPYIGRFGSKGNTDRNKPAKLKQLAALYGIDVPAEGVDGSQVDELYRTDPAKVGEYVMSDVHVLREFYRALMGYFWV